MASGRSHSTTRGSRSPPQPRRRASNALGKAGSSSTLRLVLRSAESLLAAVAGEAAGQGDEVRAIALSSQGEVVVPVDRQGQALSLAPVSMDARGEPAARAMSERFGAERVQQITGQPLNRMFSVYKIAAGDAAWRPPPPGPTVL